MEGRKILKSLRQNTFSMNSLENILKYIYKLIGSYSKRS